MPNLEPATPAALEGSAIPCSLLSTNPLHWLKIFGPGVVVASLTIGAGELIFSARAGALFRYEVLWFFVAALAMKWVMAYSIARRMVATGEHPFQLWSRFPGRWLPVTMALLALLSFPIWTAFHAGTIGTLIVPLTGGSSGGHTHLYLGILFLALCMGLSLRGGYALLEKAQFFIVGVLLLSVSIVAFMLNPDWGEVLRGILFPGTVQYPFWVSEYKDIARRPPALECISYVGVLGGSSYDYLAYAAYIREKGWGRSASPKANNLDPKWFRAPFIDCTLSFVAVLILTIVFVICGAEILNAQHLAPAGSNLLGLQASFVSPIYPSLKHFYFAGAFLAMAGTLYGTIEVAPVIAREICQAIAVPCNETKTRRYAILWVGVAGMAVLLCMLLYAVQFNTTPPVLISLLTPANLFTGVLGCGIICLLTPILELQGPRAFRLPTLLIALNFLCAAIFIGIGLYAYWEHSGYRAFFLLAATVGCGILGSSFLLKRKSGHAH